MEKEKKYLFLGLFFVFIQIVAIIRNVSSGYNNFFWFCDFASLPIAIGFFLKKDDFVKSIVNIGLFPQIIYILAFVYKIFSGVSILETIPDTSTIFYFTSSIIIHLSTIFALCFTYKTKPRISTLFHSIMFIFGMYVIALFFTNPQDRINYVLSSRTLLPITIPYYTELWSLLTFLIVVLPTQGIQYLIYRYYEKNEGKKKVLNTKSKKEAL
ncbi:MAG: hypothetical protein AABW73_01480 [Nanoarchaeota archaeon]